MKEALKYGANAAFSPIVDDDWKSNFSQMLEDAFANRSCILKDLPIENLF